MERTKVGTNVDAKCTLSGSENEFDLEVKGKEGVG